MEGVSHSLHSLKGVIHRDYIGEHDRGYSGNTRSLDYSSVYSLLNLKVS